MKLGMRLGTATLGYLLTLAIPGAAQEHIDLTAFDQAMTGPRTQVLVLGSIHLQERPQPTSEKSLAALLDKLARYQPNIITIEAIGGEQCDLAARHEVIYGADYCANAELAQAATGLDIPAAIVEVKKKLDAWPPYPTPTDRRRLAALFLAAGDRPSAYVQWLQLAPSERHAGDSLDEDLVALLQKIATRKDESYQLAAVLAARLGLQRVYSVDDHTGDNHQLVDSKAFAESTQQAWKAGGAELQQLLKRQEPLAQADDLLPLYRFINQTQNLRVYAEANVVPAMRAQSPQHYPQIWVSGWEIRNLRMVANIQQSFRDTPGVRVLSIVGVSHKPWLDSWLDQMQGVDIVDVGQVLR